MKIKIDIVGPEADEAIEEFLSRAEGSLVYYTPAYRRFLSDILEDSSSITFLAREQGRVVGLLPAFVRPIMDYGDVLNSLPFFGSHGGAITEAGHPRGEYVADLLYAELTTIIKNGNFASVTVVENLFRPITKKEERILDCTVVDDRIGQFTRLPVGSADPGLEIFGVIHQKTRNSVRKGQQLNLRIEERNDAESLAWLQSVHEVSIRALGGVAKPLSIFEALASWLGIGKHARLFLAFDKNTPVAGIFFLMHKDIVEYFTPVVVPHFRDKQALPALIFNCMCKFSQEGFSIWNWGGTWQSQDGVYRFKDRWGAEQRVYRYFNNVYNSSLLEIDAEWLVANFPWLYHFRFK